ncbi:MAG: MerR family transcriptional regulator [Lachnospiraceae bacterium]|jgi:DNA-binding transcriptional MerR regulator|nr:MerR family transcriptional regulator [Lachnospiraceae bacterium]
MDLIKITDLTRQLGLSSRTLRYYEQMGLIESVRLPSETYRYYDTFFVQRLQQIIILRKMQIPVKEILRIYENPEISTLVDAFAEKIAEIDREVTALSELKEIISTFLKKMTEKGIRKISALPLLYEEMEKQVDHLQQQLSAPMDATVLILPPMRVLTSCLKQAPGQTDNTGFWHTVQSMGLPLGLPGSHGQFEFQNGAQAAVMLRVEEGFRNETGYLDASFPGGLYACANIYVDQGVEEQFRRLVKSFDDNHLYEIDYTHQGGLQRPALLENLISPDEARELVSLLVPIKQRLANPDYFEKPVELPAGSITLEEILAENPVLWEREVALEKITPVNSPHYRILESGEAEYTGWISTRVLNTNVAVKLPFRVDMEFRLGENDEQFGYGSEEGCILFYHGTEPGQGTEPDYYAGGVSLENLSRNGFGVNMGNQPAEDLSKAALRREAIAFRQPVFHDLYEFPGRGSIREKGCNRVTWILGPRHLAVIINGEIRYCGVGFPYMSLDLSRAAMGDIIIGSNGQGMKYFRSIRISQLAYIPKVQLKKEELLMITKQSNNILPHIHRLVTDEYGENYWFNGSARYVMECLGETDYDYSFFAGITGDVFTQYYPKGEFRGEGVSSYMLAEGPHRNLRETDTCFTLVSEEPGYAETLFEKCGYASTFVSRRELRKNPDMYLQTLISYIDRGIPVIVWGLGEPPVGVLVGYEEYGRTLLYLTGNNNRPDSIALEKFLEENEFSNPGWIFIGSRKEKPSLAGLYRETVRTLPKLLATETESFYFGASAFRAWAEDIEGGRFDCVKPEEFDPWGAHTAYVCGLATNASCCHGFLEKALELNPDLGFLKEVSALYKRCGEMWNHDNGTDLEALGGGFNVTLEALQDGQRRSRIADKLREFAEVTEDIERALRRGVKERIL